MAAMASHLGVVDVRMYAMAALCALAGNHAINQERIGDTTGALGEMVAGMEAHPGDWHVQYQGMSALHVLARHSVGNQHRMRASPQLLRLVVTAAQILGVEVHAGAVLTALGMTGAQASAAAAKVSCHHRHPSRVMLYDRSASSPTPH